MQEVKNKLSKEKDRGSITVVKNELPQEFHERASALKDVLRSSNLSQGNMRKVELMLRDKGADYFKIGIDQGRIPVDLFGRYDLIWKFHGLGCDFIVFIDFD